MIPERTKKQHLSFLCSGNYFHDIYIVLHIINNLGMI